MLLKSNGVGQTGTVTVTATSHLGYTGQTAFAVTSIQDNDPSNPGRQRSMIRRLPGAIPDQLGAINTPIHLTIPSVEINTGGNGVWLPGGQCPVYNQPGG